MLATKSKPNRPKAEGRLNLKRLAQRRWTFDELAAGVPESNLPIELWDGAPIMSPAPSFFHQQIAFRFHKMLDAWVTDHQLGKTVGSPIDMILTARHATQPDVLFISNQRLEIIQDRVRGAADLVTEVLSPGSRHRDRIEKRDLYEQHGVKEYWIVDPEAETVEVFFLDRGEYRLVGRWRPGEQAKSQLLEGFVMPVAELFVRD